MYIFIKAVYKIKSIIKKQFYKCIYRNKIKFGNGVNFRKSVSLASVGGKIEIGNNVFFNHFCSVYSMNSIKIGAGTIFGENVKIYDHNHCYSVKNIPIKDQGYTSAPIFIGKHCWIASNVTILKGVTIGDNCVIGAGCTVYKDVPPNTILLNKQDLIEKPNIPIY